MDFLFYNFQTIMGSSTLDRIISSLSPPHHVQEQYPDQRHLHCPPYKERDTIKFNTHTKKTEAHNHPWSKSKRDNGVAHAHALSWKMFN